MAVLTPEQKREIARRLVQREQELNADIGREQAKRENYPQVAGEVPDAGDASFTALLKDLDEAEIGRDVDERRAIVRALRQIGEEDYGLCIECGRPITYERLLAEPAALRCVRCQSLHEHLHDRAGAGPKM